MFKFFYIVAVFLVSSNRIILGQLIRDGSADRARNLRDHDQKIQKFEHWQQVKDLPLADKQKDAQRRKTEYIRRSNQLEERYEEYHKKEGRYSDDPEKAAHEAKVLESLQTRNTFLRRQARLEQRSKSYDLYLVYRILLTLVHIYSSTFRAHCTLHAYFLSVIYFAEP